MNGSEIIKIADENLLHTYGRYPVVAYKGKGTKLWDMEGNEYLDLGSGIGVNALGYCDDDWQKAVAEQLGMIQHCSNYFYNDKNALLAKKIAEVTGLKKSFLCNSGAEANEGAIKVARKYSFDKYGKGRATIICLNNSFHGRTITTLTATGQDVFHQFFDPFTEGFIFAGLNDKESFLKAAEDKTVCAVLVEGIQGEGGVLPMEEDFAKLIEETCRENDWLLIFDEIQTGMGRTGEMFSYQGLGVTPDVVTLAKGLAGGLPVGAFVCGEKCEGTFGPSHHGSTFGGNPVVSAGALVVMEKVMNKPFLDEVKKKGEFFKEKLLEKNLPQVKLVRGKGLMIGVVLDGVAAKDVAGQMVKNGVLPLTAGAQVLRLLPPLIISYEELTTAVDAIEQAIKEVAAK